MSAFYLGSSDEAGRGGGRGDGRIGTQTEFDYRMAESLVVVPDAESVVTSRRRQADGANDARCTSDLNRDKNDI